MSEHHNEGMLSPYRVLDLTDEKGLFCGKLLGDLGADVIKIEKPGGDLARNIGPFYHDEVDPEKSLFWFAYNACKRGITLDIEAAEGQETFKKLVRGADIVIESSSPGYLDSLGLGYSALEKVNAGIIMISITPFGQTGPYRDYKAPDIVAWATGGKMYPYGDVDRSPIRISHHSQAYLHAGAQAAIGVMMALCYREMTGEGQQVDVSVQEAVAQTVYTAFWDTNKVIRRRGDDDYPNRLPAHMGQGVWKEPDLRVIRFWPCKDGYIIWSAWGGAVATRYNTPLIQWMDSEGMADDYLKDFDWDSFSLPTTTQEIIDRLSEQIGKFFMTHTKAELWQGALKYGIMLAPLTTMADVIEDIQLVDRGYWVELEHPELGAAIIYPGAFGRASEAPLRSSRRAPLIGEHNQEVYEKELDLSREVQKSGRARNYPAKLLEGVKILDFTWVWAGPLSTKTFSDYGAQVVKIESSIRPGVDRTGGPFKDEIPGLNRCAIFNQYNTGKLSLTLNIAHPKGIETAKRLAAWADVVVENFAGGTMQRLGLGYEELKKVKSDIIMLSSCLYGQTGPYASHPGYGGHLAAMCGFNYIAGWPDREPAWLHSYTDFVAPHFNALTILAALDYRNRTGKGQYLDMSQYENSLHFLAPLILDYTVNGRVANRMGNRYAYAAPHGVYRCQGDDRWCAIAVFTDEEWVSFSNAIGNPSWTKDPRFGNLAARKENEDELDRLIEEWTINQTAEEVMALLQAAGVPAGAVANGEDLMEHDSQLKHRYFFGELDHPDVGKYRSVRSPFMLSKSPQELQRAPLLGEHNEYVLKELLALSDDEIAELVVEGVIE